MSKKRDSTLAAGDTGAGETAGKTVGPFLTLEGLSRRKRLIQHIFAVLLCLLVGTITSLAQDARELVRLPEPMQAHMLGNMRDHLATLNEIIGDVANEKFDTAAKITEQRLGMSSLTAHDAVHLAPYFPKPMQDIGTSMHQAASRLVIVLQDASVTPNVEAMRNINRALHEVTTACEACHASYRLR